MVYKTALSAVCGVTSYVFGGWDSLIMLLVLFVFLDFVTGIIASSVQKILSSRQGFKGIAKKVFIFALVAVAHSIDFLLGTDNMIRDTTVVFYLVNEFISIIENAQIVGVPIPKVLANAINLLKKDKKE
jgi:toxin secretion/phage lysis holin